MKYDPTHFEKQFQAFLSWHTERVDTRHILLAMSGGIDSTVLAHLFARSHMPFAMAHAHFGLRKEADEEKAFVQTLAKKYGVPCHTASFDVKTYAKTHKVSLQMAARTLRYAWFQKLLETHRYQQIATAHHLNDVIETCLRNLTKGTGIRGLRSIPARQGHLIRPLLFATRKGIITYAEACGLSWKEDSSNAQTEYDRNFIRHEIIPSLKKLNPSLETTFATSLERFQQVEQLFSHEVACLRSKAWKTKGIYHHIALDVLSSKPWAGIVLEAWLAPFGFHLRQLQPWLSNPPQPGKSLQSPTHWLMADRNAWIVGPLDRDLLLTEQAISYTLEEITSHKSAFHAVVQERKSYTADLRLQNPTQAILDLDTLTFPLVVRPWKQGDTFYPFTHKKRYRKKVSDLLIDEKVPLHQKKEVKVILSGEQIVWVVGFQIDDRFKVSDGTTRLLIIKGEKPF
ncbi:MAG: tRNA lysidine(34) synthetase TilS [Bacteroidota bacterium]